MNAASAPPMKIAIAIEHFNPEGGGAERSTAQIARELAARGHTVTLLAASAAGVCPPGITVVARYKSGRLGACRLIGFARWVRRTLAAGGFDASLSVTTAAPAAVLQPRSGTIRETLDRNIAMRPGAAERLLKRTLVALSPKQRVLLMLERQTLNDPLVKRIAAVSLYVSDQLQRHYHTDPAKIELLPNAAETPPADDAQRVAWRKTVRDGFNIPQDAVVFLFAAYNPRLKGVRQLLRAMKVLQDRGVNAVVMLAGESEYAQQRMAAELGIRERVRMIGPTSRMAPLYCAADVTVHPTHYDPSSKVVIESLMMGTPAITTSFNGAGDFLTAPDGRRRGRVVRDSLDVAALAQAMEELADPAERARCLEATAGMADALSMRRHVDRLEAILRQAGEAKIQARLP